MNDIDWPVLRAYKGKKLRRIRMPLGGIGTGKVSLCGTGGLRSFEIRNATEKDFTPCRESVCPAFVLRVEDAAGAVAARLAGPGMHWRFQNGLSIVELRAVLRSGLTISV